MRRPWGSFAPTNPAEPVATAGGRFYIPRADVPERRATAIARGDRSRLVVLRNRRALFGSLPAATFGAGSAALPFGGQPWLALGLAGAGAVAGVAAEWSTDRAMTTGAEPPVRIAHSKYGMRIAQTADVILQQRTRIEARSPGTNHDQFLVEAIRDMLWSAIDNPYADFDGVLWPMTDLANAAEARNATMRMLAGGTDEYATCEVEFDPIPAPPEAHQTAQLAILRMESELQQQLGEQYNLRQHDLAPDADSDPLARLELEFGDEDDR